MLSRNGRDERVKSIIDNDNDDGKLKKQTTNNFNEERKSLRALQKYKHQKLMWENVWGCTKMI